MDVAVIGLGNMGNAVAERLLDQGMTVRAWNRTPGRASERVMRGATIAGSARLAAAGADAVLLILANDDAVRDVLAAGGVAEQVIDDGSVLVNMSTIAPASALEFARQCGRNYVEAPILAPPDGMRRGDAVLVLAGPPALRTDLGGLWDALAASITDVGEIIGKATTLKLVSNQLLIGANALLAEAILTAQDAGIELEMLRPFLQASKNVPEGIRNRVDMMLDGDFAAMFSTDLAAKDIGLALDLSEHAEILAATNATADLLARAHDQGHGADDLAALAEAVRHA